MKDTMLGTATNIKVFWSVIKRVFIYVVDNLVSSIKWATKDFFSNVPSMNSSFSVGCYHKSFSPRGICNNRPRSGWADKDKSWISVSDVPFVMDLAHFACVVFSMAILHTARFYFSVVGTCQGVPPFPESSVMGATKRAVMDSIAMAFVNFTGEPCSSFSSLIKTFARTIDSFMLPIDWFKRNAAQRALSYHADIINDYVIGVNFVSDY